MPPAAAASAVASAAPPLDSLPAAWSALLSALGSPDSEEPAGLSRTKLILSRCVQLLSVCALDGDAQRLLMFLRSLAEADLALQSTGQAEQQLERNVTMVFPYIHTCMEMMANPAAAAPSEFFFAQVVTQTLDAFLQLLDACSQERDAIHHLARDADCMMAEIMGANAQFCAEHTEEEFEAELSPYHAAVAVSLSPLSPGAAASPPFRTIRLSGWRRFKQYSACRCCRRVWTEENAARSQRKSVDAAPCLSPCSCSFIDDGRPCPCPTSVSFLSSPPPAQLAAHPLFSFLTLNLHLHSSDVSVAIGSAQQLHFFTEKLLQLSLRLLELQQASQHKQDSTARQHDMSAGQQMDTLRTVMICA